MGWPRVKAKAVWASEWKSQRKKKKCRGGERGTCKIKDFGETLIVTWLEGFWDFELGKGCGYTL